MLPIIIIVVFVAGVALSFYLIKRKNPLTVNGPLPSEVQRAFQVVWVDLWKLPLSACPLVQWVSGDRLDCHDGEGWISDVGCVAGLSWRATNRSAIAWPKKVKKISGTAFVHELRHARSWHTGENSDHLTPEFQNDVADGNAALKAVDL